jgi:hypothetical protein
LSLGQEGLRDNKEGGSNAIQVAAGGNVAGLYAYSENDEAATNNGWEKERGWRRLEFEMHLWE